MRSISDFPVHPKDVTGWTDVFGKDLTVPSIVRSYDHPWLSKDGGVWGLDQPGEGERVSFLQGILEDIGGEVIEGCRRYRIKVLWRGGPDGIVELDLSQQRCIYPPLNGTKQISSCSSPVTFGVVLVTSDPEEMIREPMVQQEWIRRMRMEA